MNSEKIIKILGHPPVPTPKQLKNSITALELMNPNDKRIVRYKEMIIKSRVQEARYSQRAKALSAI